ncbi:MAG TPA: hypothetical protein VL727_19425 [Puia sp.]|jgi:hypothetical protein|nr:hypothetical protein [Puia sp.]
MKQSKLAGMLLYAAMPFFFASCGGGGSETKTISDSTRADSATVAVMPKTTTITTPQNMMVVTHKVANFAKWLPSYEAHDSMRLASGIHSYVIGRNEKDSNMVLVGVKVDDLAKAKTFAKDPSLKEAMKKGGVVGSPSFSFVTMTFQDTAMISSNLRSRTTFTVKDWDAWQKAFQEGEKERADNGITVRAYGHDPDNDKKVTLVTAVMDTAKAFAYWKSDMLKQRRAASGVIGEPQRFLYRVIKRY